MSKSEIKINIEKGKIFKGWIYDRFPFIQEDFDSLTSYELWCKVVEYLNKTISAFNDNFENTISAFNELQNYVNKNVQNLIDDFNTFKSDMNTLYNTFTTNLVSEFNTFKSDVNNEVSTFESNMTTSFNTLSDNFTALETYVNNYFNNLDVQTEIDNKLDEMVENGIFDNLIESQVIPEITNFMDSYAEVDAINNGTILDSSTNVFAWTFPSGFNADNTIILGGFIQWEYEDEGEWFLTKPTQLFETYENVDTINGFSTGLNIISKYIQLLCNATKLHQHDGQKMYGKLYLKKVTPYNQ